MHKERTIIVILSALLLIAVGYVAINLYNERQNAQLQSAAEIGYQQAIVEIMQQASSCEPVPVHAGNVTMNLIPVECLQQQQAIQQGSPPSNTRTS